ncbi:hypothetical protein [Aurantimonas endophytica]|uniref:Mg-chelatase subunit ChlD n=1 Tax=Aurantimonas endophytica TaxID=1522175 RepID=A0A7W6HBB6_9HYPH|nr:hypothetical protein [Aurantimonas endophytica]MBB4002069.1 Mg-chelatase subunit ChlD [Aurantimonas endophytica]MCO6402299.1 hypothetical protein [Aurantimonas endophytica]
MVAASNPPAATESDLEEFADLVYALRHRVSSSRPGNHASRSPGSYGRFAGLDRLSGNSDLRRLDLRASIADPFASVWVRRYLQAASGVVHVVVDLSGSMGFRGSVARHAVAATLAGGLTRAAIRSGDRASVRAATGDRSDAFVMEPTRRASAPSEVAMALAAIAPAGSGLSALRECCSQLSTTPGLVFLISDFAAAVDAIRPVLDALVMHDVRAVVVGDPEAEVPAARFGLAHLDDLEDRRGGVAFLRPSLLRRWRERRREHGRALSSLFAETGCPVIPVTGQIDLEQITETLIAGQATL